MTRSLKFKKDILVKLRLDAGLTQDALAAKLDVCSETVSRAERGAYQAVKYVMKFAEFFDVDWKTLLDEVPATQRKSAKIVDSRPAASVPLKK